MRAFISLNLKFSAKMKFLIVVLCLCFADLVISEENITAVQDQCLDLNLQRLDLSDCCDYPRIHFFKIFASSCVDECVGTKDICCSMVCVWRNAKVTFHDGTVQLDGLKKALLHSVRHKEEWENLIHKVVDQCDSESKLIKITGLFQS